jgi:hypothetical protein
MKSWARGFYSVKPRGWVSDWARSKRFSSFFFFFYFLSLRNLTVRSFRCPLRRHVIKKKASSEEVTNTRTKEVEMMGVHLVKTFDVELEMTRQNSRTQDPAWKIATTF